MVAPFKCDEKVTIEHDIGEPDPVYGRKVENWAPLLARYFANVQDVPPSRRDESTVGGLRLQKIQTRLRMRGVGAVTGTMRAVLHGHGDRVMKIIAGPALLDDRVHYEFLLEDFSS